MEGVDDVFTVQASRLFGFCLEFLSLPIIGKAETSAERVCSLFHIAYLGWQNSEVYQLERPSNPNGIFPNVVSGLSADEPTPRKNLSEI